MAEIIWPIIRVAAGVYIGLCVLLYARQTKYVFYPSRKVIDNPGDLNLHFDDVLLETQDGETISCWYIPSGGYEGSGKVVLFSHGNAGNIGDRLGTIEVFHKMGYDVMVYDYRGYGASTGSPTEEGTYLDALAVWNYVKGDKGIPPEKIVIFGRSLGGGISAWLAEQARPGALIIESSFLSAADMAKKMFPYLPVKLLCRYKYSTVDRIKNIDCPVVIAHSPDDEMIPFKHGQKLYKLAGQPKMFVEMSGGHNAGGLDIDTDYQKRLAAFLAEHIDGVEPK
jgi:fermentation-respiration switch protein FrsA (DUF1100 family)